MQQAALELEAAGCGVLCTPCNTAHSRLADIARPLERAHFVHMPQETANFAVRLGCTRVAVLATDGTRATGVYDRALEAAGIEAVWPDVETQREVMSIIYDEVKAGRAGGPEHVEAVCATLAAAGCDGIILGCTELSVVNCPHRVAGAHVVDALDVLAWRCVQACGAPARDVEAAFAVVG